MLDKETPIEPEDIPAILDVTFAMAFYCFTALIESSEKDVSTKAIQDRLKLQGFHEDVINRILDTLEKLFVLHGK